MVAVGGEPSVIGGSEVGEALKPPSVGPLGTHVDNDEGAANDNLFKQSALGGAEDFKSV